MEMFSKTTRNVTARDHDPRLHVLLKSVTGEVCTSQERYASVGNGRFRVNASFRELTGTVSPSIQTRCGHISPHGFYGIHS